jgi:hypothetical protein
MTTLITGKNLAMARRTKPKFILPCIVSLNKDLQKKKKKKFEVLAYKFPLRA